MDVGVKRRAWHVSDPQRPSKRVRRDALSVLLEGTPAPSNWDEATAGKQVFMNFYAPWCGHCKKLAPAWAKLMQAHENHPTILVAKVDCTNDVNEGIRKALGVNGFPTILYGAPGDMKSLQAYSGDRGLKALHAFVMNGLSDSATGLDSSDLSVLLEGTPAPSNWDEATAGKQVFMNFYAPWCGHCKKLAPTWAKLMETHENHPTILVAKVDCTNDVNEGIRKALGVDGFPTILYGDPNDTSSLEPYEGGRGLSELHAFVSNGLTILTSG